MSRLDELNRYREALEKIAALDPEKDSEDGFNEWGEAECFGLAQEIARQALLEVAPVARVAVEAGVSLPDGSARKRNLHDQIASSWDARKHGTGPLFGDY